jgi:diguanylate cyclase (GGDEF)-like protein
MRDLLLLAEEAQVTTAPGAPDESALRAGLAADEPAEQAGPVTRSVRVIAVVALLVLIALLCFAGAVLEGRARAAAVRESVGLTDLSDAWQDGVHAAAVEQSLERAWRLGREDDVLRWQARAADEVEAALDRIVAAGAPRDASAVEVARSRHAAHRASFAAERTAGTAAAAATESSSEELQDALSLQAHRAYDLAVASRRSTTAPPGLLLTLLLVGAGSTVAALAIALVHARRSSARLSRLRRRTEHLAFHDGLTGLPNRVVLRDRLEQALLTGAREGSATALLIIDLDRFKEINDALGHDYGDLLLQALAPRLSGPLRTSDTVARLGGDEFAVLLPRVADLDAALLVAEKLQAALVHPFVIEGLSLSIEASIGVAVAPDHATDPGVLLQRADVAMYVAKDAGLGVSAYDRILDGSSPARAAMLGELRRAIEEGQLRLVFQPKRAVASGALEGVEALVRWQHPVHGLLSPEHFLPLAERTGLVHPLTRYVLGAALAECRRWLDVGIELPVAVNLSARSLLDRGFAEEVLQMLDFWRVPGSLLELEVTETAVMADPERARALMAQLATAGVVMAIDDFGTGYSSLASLRTLPVHDLKVDRTFVTDMLRSPNDAFIVRSVIALAHDVGLRVVAEGVEDEDVLQVLRELGCDVAQGYHIGAPVSGDEMRDAVAALPPGGVARPVRPLDGVRPH